MGSTKVTFTNKDHHQLVGKLEVPDYRHIHNYVIFAHCFTCTKNLKAVRNISRAMTSKGFGVLRFDFTGLGESEGAFEDTNFSGNVEDLIAAAGFLEEKYKAPALLIGHSLGGAAVLFAASEIPSVQAVVTIGAPSNPKHVQHLLKSNIEEIETQGKAIVNLAGRDFTIKKHFLDDLENKSISKTISKLDVSLLIMHSPQDTTVGIKNAEEIYLAAKHPKSFITLDGADHLLSDPEDSLYTGQVISSWSFRYLNIDREPDLESKHQVVGRLDHEKGYTTQLKMGKHHLIADEPEHVGGADLGPTPYDLVSSGLASCTVMTLHMYARRKKWNLTSAEAHIDYSREYPVDCEHCDDPAAKIDTFRRFITVKGELEEKQIKRLLEIADKCPVHKSLHSEIQVITELI